MNSDSLFSDLPKFNKFKYGNPFGLFKDSTCCIPSFHSSPFSSSFSSPLPKSLDSILSKYSKYLDKKKKFRIN